MTIYLHEFIKSSLVDLHLKPSEEDLKQWFDRWPLNIDFFRNINGKPFRFLFAYHTYLAVSDISDDAVVCKPWEALKSYCRCWLFLTSLTRKAQFQEAELEKQPSSSKRRLQSLAKKRTDVKYMAEILPVRSARTVKSPRSLDSFGSAKWCKYHNKDAPDVYIILTALASGVTDLKRVCFSRIVRNKRNSGGQITEEESTNNTIYEWSTKPVRKCLTETLLPQPFKVVNSTCKKSVLTSSQWVSIRFVDSLQHLGSKELLQIITTISFTVLMMT
ncbi:hypothetical protein Bca4012_003239 [Brassica carinata]